MVHPHDRPEKRDPPEGVPRHRGVPEGVLPQGPEVHAPAHPEGRGGGNRRARGDGVPHHFLEVHSDRVGYLCTEALFLKLGAGNGHHGKQVLEGGCQGDHQGNHRAGESERNAAVARCTGGTRGEAHGSGGRGLSDQKIVEILAAKGVSLARRTVAKYRGELAIESSYQRRRT